MDDLVEILTKNLCKFFINHEEKIGLVKKSEKITDKGDFSFPISIRMWRKFVDVSEDLENLNILKYLRRDLSTDEILDELIRTSQNWQIPIKRAEILNERCVLYLDRHKTYSHLIPMILENPESYGKIAKIDGETVAINQKSITNSTKLVSDYRIELVGNALKNLLDYSQYSLTENFEDARYKFLITNKSNNKKDEVPEESTKIILCGVVTDAKKGNKLSDMTASDYIKKRANDINLMAQHKYGLRVKNDKSFIELIEKLGNYAVTVDFLEIKAMSPVGLNYNSAGIGSSKGASFILYNSARLETLMDNFDRKVKDGYYPALPDFRDIDINLLKEEEEWHLMFHYILTFPDLIKRCINDITDGKINIHLICNYLSGLVGLFSVYYRRVRLLTENRSQLIPVLHAKMYLLRCLRIVFNKTLKLLNIEPVKFM